MSDRNRPSRSADRGVPRYDSAPRQQSNLWDDADDWDAPNGAEAGDDWDQPTARRLGSRPSSRQSPLGASGRSGAHDAGRRRDDAWDDGAADDDDTDLSPRPRSRSLRDDEPDEWERSARQPAPRGRAPTGRAPSGAAYAGSRAAYGGSRVGARGGYGASRPGAQRPAAGGRRWGDTIERWAETSSHWVAAQAQRIVSSERRAAPGASGWGSAAKSGAKSGAKPVTKTNRRMMLAVIFAVMALPLLGGIQLVVVYAQAKDGLQHFKNAQTDLSGLGAHPFDATAIAQMRAEFSSAYSDFSSASAGVQRIPSLLGKTPIAGSKLAGAQRLLPIAAEGSQAGMLVCDALATLAPKMKNPFDTTTGAGITADDLKALSASFAQIQPLVTQILAQVGALQPADLTLDSRLGPMVAAVLTKLPEIKQVMTDLQATLAVAGSLLGVGQPSAYLLEVLDSTELRPGGGFIGNYGFITLSGGHLGSIKMQDVDLLDANVKYGGQVIPIPDQYSWFRVFSRWGFRDSNLDADFPTSAQNGEHLYKQEAGSSATPTVGVIAITPWFIRDALKITGSITLPEYGGLQINADNLVDKIHYYQLTSGIPIGPDNVYDPQCGSSARKCFTGYLFKHFMETVKAQSAKDMGPLMKTLVDALHSKNIQVYLDPAPAEDILVQTHLGSTIDAPASGDSLFVVDANIIANKANYVVADTISDQVTLDAKGTATHHTTLTYTWPKDPNTLNETYPSPQSSSSRLVQYQRLYVPPGAKLTQRSGWYATDAGSAFNRQVWSGKVAVSYGSVTTLTVDWSDPGAVPQAGGVSHYAYLLQRQAGAVYTLDLKLTLPTCAQLVATPSGFKAADAHTLTLAPEPFATDTNVTLDYTGC